MKGEVKWAESADVGYFAQDHADDFKYDYTLFDWMSQWTQGGEQLVRGTLGRMLFSNDDILKSVKVISGGEQGRMLFGKMILQKANVMLMDEPTNHLDMESIEALNLVHQHNKPENRLKRGLARLVAKDLLRYQGAGPTAEQLGYMQGIFRSAPAADFGAALVDRVLHETGNTDQQIDRQRPDNRLLAQHTDGTQQR